LTNAIETTASEVKKEEQQKETPLEFLASMCSILAVYLFVIAFVFQTFEIPSGSMEKTLLIGDHLLVDRISLAPAAKWAPFMFYREVKRGDIIVFLKPGYPDLFLVKRAIGLPGDRIHLKDGVVYLNGVRQDEPQISMPSEDGQSYRGFDPYRDDFPAVPPDEYHDVTASWQIDLPNHIQDGDLVVPPGKVFAMGDNRINSLDGRFWGFVPRENILGRPLFNYWSFVTPEEQILKQEGGEPQSIGDRISYIGHIVIHFFDQTRWRRTFHIVR